MIGTAKYSVVIEKSEEKLMETITALKSAGKIEKVLKVETVKLSSKHKHLTWIAYVL